MYGKEIVAKMADIFMNDVNKSAIMDDGYLKIQSRTEKLMQMLMRLFSPLF
jgi:hypothetical protein